MGRPMLLAAALSAVGTLPGAATAPDEATVVRSGALRGLSGASCADLGCNATDVPGRACQCNSMCGSFQICCADFEDQCSNITTFTATTPSPAMPLAAGGMIPSVAPKDAMSYKGMAWPDLSIAGTGEMHFFGIGDWGGLDGTLLPTGGRARLIVYKGGHTAGPHVFPRTRWNKDHSELLCSHDDFVQCYDTSGASCSSGCGFVEGVDTQPQQLVAAAFKERAAKNKPKFVVNVGDNFYWGGLEINCGSPMSSISATTQHQFDQVFEGIYSGPGLGGVPWLSVLGNHDWGGRVFNNGWDQQIAYTWASNRWVMPAPYWSQTVHFTDLGFSVDVFMIDSNAMDAKEPTADPEHNLCSSLHNPSGASCSSAGGPPSVDECRDFFWGLWQEQQPWLEQKLADSKADWQIVNTHFPCGHEAAWYTKLHTVYGLDLLITGHRHDQELHANSGMLGGMTCVVTGGGGGISSEATPGDDHSQWYGEAQYGFYDFTISKSSILIESINYDGTVALTATVFPK